VAWLSSAIYEVLPASSSQGPCEDVDRGVARRIKMRQIFSFLPPSSFLSSP